MKRKKLFYIVSDIDKSLHFEWVSAHLMTRYHLSFILIGSRNTKLEKFLREIDAEVFNVEHAGKKNIVSTWVKVFRIIKKAKPDIVHTHLWVANIVGLTSSWLLNIRKRIFTRHHGTIHYTEFRSGIKWDKLCNSLATDIIAISRNVQQILIEMDGARKEKVTLIHHGFDFTYFTNVGNERVDQLKKKLNLPTDAWPVVGVIARFVEWKGVQYVIPAFARILDKFPAAILVLANANGSFEPEIKRLLKEMPASSFRIVPFENDLAALYKTFDVFVHVPIDPRSEAFGQTYVEPLIAGIPAIFTLSGVATEFIENDKNALVVGFKNSKEIEDRLLYLLTNRNVTSRLVDNGLVSVKDFTISAYLDRLNYLYSQ